MGAPNRPSLAGGEAEKVEEEAVLNRAPGRKGGAGEERREKISLGRRVVYMKSYAPPPTCVILYGVLGVGRRRRKAEEKLFLVFGSEILPEAFTIEIAPFS